MPAASALVSFPSVARALRPWGSRVRPLLAAGVLVGAAVGTLLGARRAQAGEVCHITGVHVHRRPEGHELRLHTDCAPAFHTLRLSDPARLVVDVDQGEVGAMAGILTLGDGVISQLVLSQAGGSERPVGRLEIGLATARTPEVTREGQDVVVRTPVASESLAAVQGAGDPLSVGSRAFVPSAAWPLAPVVDAAAAEAQARPRANVEPSAHVVEASVHSFAPEPAAPTPTSTEQSATKAPMPARVTSFDAPPPAAAAEEASHAGSVAAGAHDAVPAPGASTPAPPRIPRHPTLRAMRAQGGGALLAFRGAPMFTSVRLEDPPRLVVDVPHARTPRRRLRLHGQLAWLKGVRLGSLPGEGGLRVVFDLTQAPTLEVRAAPRGLWVGPAAADAGGAPASSLSPAPAASLGAPAPARSAAADAPSKVAAGPARLTQLRANKQAVDGRTKTSIFIGGAATLAAEVDAQNARAWILTLHGATLPARLEGPLAEAGGPGAVSLVSAYQAQREPAEVQLVVSLRGRAVQRLERVAGGLMWHIDEEAGTVATARAPSHASGAYFRTGAFRADAPGTGSTASAVVAATSLRNHRISLDVKDADVVNVLRLISEETGENIIASDEVKGKITLKLRNVPAEQALDTVLRIKGLDRVRQNNILRIASAETIQKERDLEVARKKALIEVEEVGIKMVTVNYATASEVIEQLKPMLSARGSLQVDQRTNTVIVQDVMSNVERLIELARRLDKQTPLVNIQARIVEATSNFARDLGVQWGGASQHSARTGNPTGVYFPADVSASGAADLPSANQTAGVVNPARYAVNFPALLSGQGAGLGFVLGSAGGTQLLDLRLSAMESNGNGRIISSPEVSTLDNKTARVSQGIQIPVSTVSAAGTMTRFVPAVLQLEVTPHVTNDGTVLMKIHVEKSAPDFAQKGGQGDPTINTRQADTEVLVRDGDTSVIGGILTRETSESRSEVPFFARIPILGSLFRRHTSAENRAELLVFITPRIINREASTVQAGSVFDRQNN